MQRGTIKATPGEKVVRDTLLMCEAWSRVRKNWICRSYWRIVARIHIKPPCFAHEFRLNSQPYWRMNSVDCVGIESNLEPDSREVYTINIEAKMSRVLLMIDTSCFEGSAKLT